jgi:hypothetical protein
MDTDVQEFRHGGEWSRTPPRRKEGSAPPTRRRACCAKGPPGPLRIDCDVNRPETIRCQPRACPKRQRGLPRMSIFNHPHAIAASKCANCHHLEVIIAGFQAWVDDLRQSRNRWRELAVDAKRIADFAEHAPAEAACMEGDPFLKG